MTSGSKVSKNGPAKLISRAETGVLLERLDNDVLLINQLKHKLQLNATDPDIHNDETNNHIQIIEPGPIENNSEKDPKANKVENNYSVPDANQQTCPIQQTSPNEETDMNQTPGNQMEDKTVNHVDTVKQTETGSIPGNQTQSKQTLKDNQSIHSHSITPQNVVPSSESVDSTETEDSNWLDNADFYKNIDTKTFRQYELACDRVKLFYEEQHEKQTVAYNIQARINFKTKTRAKMSIWEGLEKLNKLLDDSDPDTELSQIDHALQTAEAIRRDGKPRWFQLIGLIHDLGKLLYFFDSKGQWDVVGDTFPVGCKFLKKIILPNSFKRNPDFFNPLYNTKYGIYSKNCGLDKVMLSWGHDEYMYHVAKENSTLPKEALAMIRYHSFYPWHQDHAYNYLMDEHDKEMLRAVKAFNTYDLYSKIDKPCNVEELKPYYLELIDEYFPTRVIEF